MPLELENRATLNRIRPQIINFYQSIPRPSKKDIFTSVRKIQCIDCIQVAFTLLTCSLSTILTDHTLGNIAKLEKNLPCLRVPTIYLGWYTAWYQIFIFWRETQSSDPILMICVDRDWFIVLPKSDGSIEWAGIKDIFMTMIELYTSYYFWMLFHCFNEGAIFQIKEENLALFYDQIKQYFLPLDVAILSPFGAISRVNIHPSALSANPSYEAPYELPILLLLP